MDGSEGDGNAFNAAFAAHRRLDELLEELASAKTLSQIRRIAKDELEK